MKTLWILSAAGSILMATSAAAQPSAGVTADARIDGASAATVEFEAGAPSSEAIARRQSKLPPRSTREQAERMLYDDRNRARLRLMPNLASNATTVEVTVPRSGPITIELFDARGERLLLRELYVDSGGTIAVSVDLRRLPNGRYHCLATHGGFTMQQALLVMR